MEHTLFEIKAAELAQNRSTSLHVKNLASALLAYHTKESGELKDLGAKKHISLPSEVSEKDQKFYEKLDSKQGKDFDCAYTKCAAKAHRIGGWYLKKESEKGRDTDIKSWAAENYPVLQKYSHRATILHKALKKREHEVRPELTFN